MEEGYTRGNAQTEEKVSLGGNRREVYAESTSAWGKKPYSS